MKQLSIDLSDSDNEMIKIIATEMVEFGDYSSWDAAYESAWDIFESELEQANE